MTDGDGSSLWVDLIEVDAEDLGAIYRLRSERLVDLEDVDVGDCKTSLLQNRWDSERWPNTHDIGRH